MDDPQSFIRAHTAIAMPPACPELPLYMASEVTKLWHATEEFLAIHGLPPPYWAFPWIGGQGLARHILDHPELVRGKTVLDFASGSGLVAIAAAKAGAKSVSAAEIDRIALAAIGLNAAENGVCVAIEEGDVLSAEPRGWDVILAGDVCYEKPMAERAIGWLKRAAAKGADILLADPGRAYLPKTGLMALGNYDIACSRDLEDRDVRTVTIYRLVG